MNPGPQLYLNCEWCHEFFEHNGGKRRRYCSAAHKQAAWRKDNMKPVINSESFDQTMSNKTNGSHECVKGLIYGEFDNNGICKICGNHVV